MKDTLGFVFASTIFVVSALAVEPTPEPLILQGTQIQKTLTLVHAKRAHIVMKEYAVPEDSELIIEAGTELAFAKDACLTVRGKLEIKGTDKAPVILKGKVMGIGAWQGLKITKSASTVISFARISGAQKGIHVTESKPTILTKDPDKCGSSLSLK